MSSNDKIGNGKICKQCGLYRDRSQYKPHGMAKDRLQSVCTVCKPVKIPVETTEKREPTVVEVKRQFKIIEPIPVRITIRSGNAEVTFKCELNSKPLDISIEREME